MTRLGAAMTSATCSVPSGAVVTGRRLSTLEMSGYGAALANVHPPSVNVVTVRPNAIRRALLRR